MSIRFENVSYIYDRKTPFEKEAVNDLSFKIENGESLAILGKTGSGKSTILQLMNGIIKPASGMVKVDEMLTINKNSIAEIRKKIGLVFQYPEHQFFADNVYEEIAFGPRNFGMSEIEIRSSIMNSIRIVNLKETILSRSPFALSGGEQRKVAIASIIACNPNYLILDEPTSSLDPVSVKNLFEIIEELRKAGKSIVIVTHSIEEALTYFRRAIVVSNGRIVFDGETQKLLDEEIENWGLLPPPLVRVTEKVKKECGKVYRINEKIHIDDPEEISRSILKDLHI